MTPQLAMLLLLLAGSAMFFSSGRWAMRKVIEARREWRKIREARAEIEQRENALTVAALRVGLRMVFPATWKGRPGADADEWPDTIGE